MELDLELQISSFSRPSLSRENGPNTVFVPSVHIVSKVTAGLKLLYRRIKDGTSHAQTQTDVNGHLKPKRNVLLADRYIIQCCVANKGQSAVLIKAQDSFQENQLVIIKVVHTTYLAAGLKEVFTLRRLTSVDHSQASHTVRLLNSFCHEGHICLVFPCYDSRPITHVLTETCLTEQKLNSALRKISRQLLTALAFLKTQEVIHADVKPDNILVEDDEDLDTVTLIDFGNALNKSESFVYHSDFEIQTLPYRAPEVHLGQPFGMEIDMWSLGCVLFECYTGQILFNGADRLEIINKIVSVLGPLPTQMCTNDKYSSDIKPAGDPTKRGALGLMTVFTDRKNYQFANFLSGLLALNPEDRMTPWQALQHPFMSADICIPFYLTGFAPHSIGVVHKKDYEFTPASLDCTGRSDLSAYNLIKLRTTKQTLVNSKTELKKCEHCDITEQKCVKSEAKLSSCKTSRCHTPCKCFDHQTLEHCAAILTPCPNIRDPKNPTSLVDSGVNSEEKCIRWLRKIVHHPGPQNHNTCFITDTANDEVLEQDGKCLQSNLTCSPTNNGLMQSAKKCSPQAMHSLDPYIQSSSQRNALKEIHEIKGCRYSVAKNLFAEPDLGNDSSSRTHSLQNTLTVVCKEHTDSSPQKTTPTSQSKCRNKSHSPLDYPTINYRNRSESPLDISHITQRNNCRLPLNNSPPINHRNNCQLPLGIQPFFQRNSCQSPLDSPPYNHKNNCQLLLDCLPTNNKSNCQFPLDTPPINHRVDALLPLNQQSVTTHSYVNPSHNIQGNLLTKSCPRKRSSPKQKYGNKKKMKTSCQNSTECHYDNLSGKYPPFSDTSDVTSHNSDVNLQHSCHCRIEESSGDELENGRDLNMTYTIKRSLMTSSNKCLKEPTRGHLTSPLNKPGDASSRQKLKGHLSRKLKTSRLNQKKTHKQHVRAAQHLSYQEDFPEDDMEIIEESPIEDSDNDHACNNIQVTDAHHTIPKAAKHDNNMNTTYVETTDTKLVTCSNLNFLTDDNYDASPCQTKPFLSLPPCQEKDESTSPTNLSCCDALTRSSSFNQSNRSFDKSDLGGEPLINQTNTNTNLHRNSNQSLTSAPECLEESSTFENDHEDHPNTSYTITNPAIACAKPISQAPNQFSKNKFVSLGSKLDMTITLSQGMTTNVATTCKKLHVHKVLNSSNCKITNVRSNTAVNKYENQKLDQDLSYKQTCNKKRNKKMCCFSPHCNAAHNQPQIDSDAEDAGLSPSETSLTGQKSQLCLSPDPKENNVITMNETFSLNDEVSKILDVPVDDSEEDQSNDSVSLIYDE
ncbi:dual specificity tyrosine-phosphorylation-regulated kinase 2/3/4 [Biomphalaria glabrata]|nr:dual specificity tyrosine-phosphorylation-regulated kinase 2/3/4; partial [Biomphalaria glabrata]